MYTTCGEKTVIHKHCTVLFFVIVLDGLNDEDVYEISGGLIFFFIRFLHNLKEERK